MKFPVFTQAGTTHILYRHFRRRSGRRIATTPRGTNNLVHRMRLIKKLQTPESVLKSRPLYGNLRMYLVFIMGGGAKFLFLALLTLLLIEIFEFPYTVAYAAGLTLGATLGFIYNGFVTFNTITGWKPRLLKSVMVVVFVHSSNWVLVYTLTEAVADLFGTVPRPEHYWTAIIFVSLVLSVANFGLNKFWVFKHP